MAFSLMEGNEAIAWGAFKGGCRFFAGYPITPASSVLTHMLSLLPPAGGYVLQGEDEIASIGYCLGASMAGYKAVTATSGPGISLCSEQISFAIGSEIPVVIIDAQRLGPSTGSATMGADGDIQFLRWGNSGGLPVIVLAPTDVRDCFELTARAMNLAEIYRCPVFIASNKEIALTKESVEFDQFILPKIVDRKLSNAPQQFKPFQVKSSDGVPDFLPFGSETLVRQTSSSHGEDGYITTNTAILEKTRERLRDKLEKRVDEFTYYEFLDGNDANTLVITYGVTARAAKEAYSRFEEQNTAGFSLLVLKTLWPVSERLIQEFANDYSRILVIEMNLGQYLLEIKRTLPEKKIDFLGQMNGMLITPDQIYKAVSNE